MSDLFLQALAGEHINFTALPQHDGWSDSQQTLSQVLAENGVMPGGLFYTAEHRALQIVEALQPIVQTATRMQAQEPMRELVDLILFIREALGGEGANAFGGSRQKLAARKDTFSKELGRGAGSGGAKIGHKIRNGEINFVTDSGNDGKGGFVDGARDNFFIEGPKIFQAAAASSYQD